ncbi:MAG TPA: septum site-determining protein MinD, partial [Desulfitobacterium dehalogenans]|nr:septum site-determining protein MinD [Desulfitobacterium dehalogenans]
GDMMDISDIIDILAIELLGVIPDDESIVISTNRGEPAVTDHSSRAGEAYRRITRRIQGEEVPLMNLDAPDGFMDKVKKFFGMK